MLKLNHVVSLPLLMVVALLFGVPGGMYAKDSPPNVPEGTLLVGPAVDGIMTFFVDTTDSTCSSKGYEKVSFVGSCRNVDIDAQICFAWKHASPAPALQETDLVAQGNQTSTGNQRFGQVVKIPFSFPPSSLYTSLVACYGDDSYGDVFLLQFQSVNDFTVLPDQTYTADVVLKRLICAKKGC